ncbi:MAG: hypothetical protein KA978_26170 [Deltaproteobacteria bacterium]|jgi:hypothetical protein|nr:hypothetical protein [Deltaproteobacteria bacterium]
MTNRTVPLASPAGSAPDARAKKILFDTFWSSKGWIDQGARHLSEADREHAKRHGMMFDPLTIGHDAIATENRRLVESIGLAKASAAFLASLTSRRLDLRSGLASFVLASAAGPHDYVGNASGACVTCGARREYRDEDLGVLNFERHKWGGVRHGDPLYTLLDLSELARADPASPTDDDRETLEKILEIVASSAPKDTPGKLSKRLADALPSSKPERDVLVEILAAIGVLAPSDPSRGSGEFVHAGAWRGADGYSRTAVARLFGPLA